jgi:arylsulfatase A-like enzyme
MRSRPSICRAGLPVLAVALAVGQLACGADAGPESAAPEHGAIDPPIRLIDQEPAEVFSADKLFSYEESWVWEMADEAGWSATPLRSLRVQGATDLRGPGSRGGFAATHRKISFTFEVDLDASALDQIEIHYAGHRPRGLELYWTADPGEADERAHLSGAFVPYDRSRYLFPLLGHPAWKGRIRELRLTVRGDKRHWLSIERILGFRRSTAVDPAALDEKFALAWRVDHDGEWRNARVAGGDEPLVWPVDVPDDACLDFGYGATGERTGAVTYGVRAEGTTLFEETVDPSQGGVGWLDATVDLGAWAGRAIELELTARVEGDAAARVDFPVWSDPRIGPCRADPAAAVGGDAGRDRAVGARPRTRSDAPPNLLLVSLDTLRADRLSAYGYERPTSPNLDAWAAGSAVLFRHAVAPASWTLPSHTTMFTGLDVHRHGVSQFGQVPAEAVTLAEMLRERGWATAAITGGGLMHPSFHLSQGFDTYRYYEGKPRKDEMTAGVDAAIRWLERAPARPWFLLFHTYEVHTPYDVRQPYFDDFSRFDGMRVREGEAERPQVTHGFQNQVSVDRYTAHGEGAEELDRDEVVELLNDVYDSGVAYADRQFARLLEALERTGQRENTVVIVTSDHGELLGEHGGRSSHASLYDENLMVPLIVAAPGGAAGSVVERQVGVVDVTPTALELLGVAPPEEIDGVSLAPIVLGGEIEGAAEVWSHAGMNNRGLSLRTDNRDKYVYNHAVWPPLPGEESRWEIGAGPEPDREVEALETAVARGQRPGKNSDRLLPGATATEEIGDRIPAATPPADAPETASAGSPESPVSDSGLAALRERARETLRTEASGARIRLRNGGDEALGARLRGPGFTIYNVKSWDVEDGEVWWDGANRVGVRLAPGRELHLLIEGDGLEPGEISIGPASVDREKWASHSFDEVTADRVQGFVLESDSWTPTSELSTSTGVWIWWQGEYPPASGANDDPDAQLEEDLRALGYVE